MLVSELMNLDVRTIYPDQLLPEAVEAMADRHITALAVVDPTERLIGVLSTADVLTAQAEAGPGPEGWEGRTVADMMTAPALTIAPDATAADAAQRLLYADVHRLFVEEDGALVGVISQTDLVRALAAHRLTL